MVVFLLFVIISRKFECFALAFWQIFTNTSFERGQTPNDGAVIGRETSVMRHRGVAS